MVEGQAPPKRLRERHPHGLSRVAARAGQGRAAQVAAIDERDDTPAGVAAGFPIGAHGHQAPRAHAGFLVALASRGSGETLPGLHEAARQSPSPPKRRACPANQQHLVFGQDDEVDGKADREELGHGMRGS